MVPSECISSISASTWNTYGINSANDIHKVSTNGNIAMAPSSIQHTWTKQYQNFLRWYGSMKNAVPLFRTDKQTKLSPTARFEG